MARQTNGTDQYLNSASAIDLSATNKIAVQAWLWWDTFGNDDDLAIELGVGDESGSFLVDPNHSVSTQFATWVLGDTANNGQYFTRPSNAAWHHYIFNYDLSAGGSGAEVASVYLDGSAVTFGGTAGTSDNGGNFSNRTLYLMSRAGTSLFGAGRIAEVAVWTGGNISGAEASSLYNGGNGAAANSVSTTATLAHYWKLCGTADPEPATTGGVNMTVNGATAATHPIGTCASSWGSLLSDRLNRLVIA